MFEKVILSLRSVFGSAGAAAEITLRDRAQILETIASYGHYFDRRDGAGFANLFAADGSWHAFRNQSPVAHVVRNGREEIEKHVNDRQRMLKDAGVETKHFMLDTIIEVKATTRIQASAMALVLWQRPTSADPLPRPVQTGYFDFSMSKRKDGWKFDRVEVHTSGIYQPGDLYK